MVTAVTPNRKVPYVLQSERVEPGKDQAAGTPPPTTFFLRDLTPAEDAEISDQGGVLRDGNFVPTSSLQQLKALRVGLVGWEGLRDAEGELIPWREGLRGEELDEQLALLPRPVRRELGKEILVGLTVSTAEKS